MPRYIIERSAPGLQELSDEELTTALREGSKKSNEVIAEMTGVVWIRSYVSVAEGKIFCEYDAPDPAALREHARRAGIAADRISQVAIEVNPGMFV